MTADDPLTLVPEEVLAELRASLPEPSEPPPALARADESARRFEDHEPAGDGLDARALRDIASAFERRAAAERDLVAAVTVARAEGHSWAAIGAMLGTSGEAARRSVHAISRITEKP